MKENSNDIISKSKNIDENGIERIWVKNNFGEPVNIKFENLNIAIDRGGEITTPPVQEKPYQAASWTDRITEGARGFAAGAGSYADMANTATGGGFNKAVGYASNAVQSGAEKLGFDKLAQSEKEFSEKLAKDDYSWHDDIKNSPTFATENTHDSTSKVMEAGGDMASDAALFKGIGYGARQLNVAVNGKKLVSPALAKVSNFLKTKQSVGALTVEFAGAGAVAEMGKQHVEDKESYNKKLNEITGSNTYDTDMYVQKAAYEMVGALVGGVSINVASRKAASMLETPIKLSSELIDILYKQPNKVENLKELGNKVYESSKEAIKNANPLDNLYIWVNRNAAKDKDSVNNMKSIMKEVGIEPNVFNTFDDNKAAYVISSWLPDESLKQMMKNDRQKFISYIEKTMDDKLGSMGEIAAKTGKNLEPTDHVSVMSAANEQFESKLNQFIDFEMQRKNSLYDKINKAVNNNNNNNNNNVIVNTEHVIKGANNLLENIFQADVSDSSKEYVKNKINSLIKSLSENDNQMQLDKYVQQLQDLGKLAYDPATLGNFNGLIYKISEEMENNLLHGVRFKKSSNTMINKPEIEKSTNIFAINESVISKSKKGLKNISKLESHASNFENLLDKTIATKHSNEIIDLIKKANANYSQSYAPIMKTELVQTVTKGQKPEFIFKIMDNIEGLKETGYMLKRIDDYLLNHHNFKKESIESRKRKVGANIERAEQIKAKDLDNLSKSYPTSLKDTIFRLKAQQIIQENVVKNEKFDPQKFINIFENRDTHMLFKELVGEEVFKKLKTNALPMARKMEKIMEMDKHYGSGLTGRSTAKTTADKTVSSGIVFGTGAAIGGINPTGAVIGAGLLGAKKLLSIAFSKAATNPRTVNRLIQIMEKGNEKQTISYLERILQSDALKYKGLEILEEEFEDDIKNSMPSKETMKKGGIKIIKGLEKSLDKMDEFVKHDREIMTKGVFQH